MAVNDVAPPKRSVVDASSLLIQFVDPGTPTGGGYIVHDPQWMAIYPGGNGGGPAVVGIAETPEALLALITAWTAKHRQAPPLPAPDPERRGFLAEPGGFRP
jgi:hypothetical protein